MSQIKYLKLSQEDHLEGEIADKLKLTRQNLGSVFNSRSGCVQDMHLFYYEAKLTNLELKTQPKQLLGSLPLKSLGPVS